MININSIYNKKIIIILLIKVIKLYIKYYKVKLNLNIYFNKY